MRYGKTFIVLSWCFLAENRCLNEGCSFLLTKLLDNLKAISFCKESLIVYRSVFKNGLDPKSNWNVFSCASWVCCNKLKIFSLNDAPKMLPQTDVFKTCHEVRWRSAFAKKPNKGRSILSTCLHFIRSACAWCMTWCNPAKWISCEERMPNNNGRKLP